MKIKVSDYIANFFADNGIKTVFTVVGGGAMHMNDSFGHHQSIHCVYNHHEQACAMAAEAYFRVNNEMAGVCVTSGPGAINALNGVVGAYQDSIPMIVVSGQVKSTMTVKSSGLSLRTLGGQEFDIVSALDNVCKYSEMVISADRIRFCLEKAFTIAKSGRPGPCWLDIPVDIQGSFIEPNELEGYIDVRKAQDISDEKTMDKQISEICERIGKAKRPIVYAGNGIRIAGAVNKLHEFINKFKIPVVTCWDSIDLMETEDDLYVGRGGTMGDRAGNFAVQNSDLLICIGSRLNIYQVGYNKDTWARGAYTVVVDIDAEELKKPTVRIDMAVQADTKEFLEALINYNCVKCNECNSIDKEKINNLDGLDKKEYSIEKQDWLDICSTWKRKYPVVTERQYNQLEQTNVYSFIDKFSRMIGEESYTVVANGSASVVGSAAYYIGKGSRFIMNCGLSSMGYDLPAAIGVAKALNNKPVYCICGDGSIMMNLQELQTIVTNKLNIKIVIINNSGYHQIRQTQTNLFNGNYVGLGPQSGDLGFPDFEKIAYAFGIPYVSCKCNDELQGKIGELIANSGFCMLEVFCDIEQFFEPKSATKRLPDGVLYSPPLEDLAPFLPENELKENMIIPMVEKK